MRRRAPTPRARRGHGGHRSGPYRRRAAAGGGGRGIAALGRLDIVVNNAGFGGAEPFFALRAAHWDRTLDLNLRAVALICSAAGRHMRDARRGRIVNITSPASRMALPNYLAYAASKAGVDAVTRGAAVALAPYGVSVTSVAPGMMDTPMQRITELAAWRRSPAG